MPRRSPAYPFYLVAFAWQAAIGAEFKTHEGADLSTAAEIQAKKPLLIYYVGDVQPAFRSQFHAGIAKIVSALHTPGDNTDPDARFLKRIGDFITYDLEILRRNADEEISVLRNEICRPGAGSPIALAIVRSSGNPIFYPDPLEAYGTCEYWNPALFAAQPNFHGTVKASFRIGSPQLVDDRYWSWQWTNHPAAFSRVLEEIRTAFPEDQYRYHLFVKGRGDARYALLGRYLFDVAQLDPSKLREAFLRRKSDFVRGTVGDSEDFEIRPELSGLVDEILAGVIPRPEGAVGITKRELLEALAERGGGDPRRGMYFSSVVFDTNASSLETSTELRPFITADDYTGLQVDNIGRFYRFGNGVSSAFPFQRLFQFAGIKSLPPGERDFEKRWQALLRELESKPSKK